MLLALLTACAPPSDRNTATLPPSSTPSPEASIDHPAASPTPETPIASPTCETMISSGAVNALTSAGLTAEPKPFMIGDTEMPDGIVCFWADYSTATDHGQLYGWSPITADEAATAQATLLAAGWKREDGPAGIYLTEDPQYAMSVDDEGYGMTYLFGDGWVKLADTKQGLILVEWAG